jgi:nitrogen regulatory protein P-II 1
MAMYLLIFVLNKEELLDDILTGLLDIGVSGATVVDTMGMLQVISQDIPIFAGFRSMTTGGRSHNKTVFSVIREEEILKEAIAFIEETCLQFEETTIGILVTTPVTYFSHLGPSK